MTAPLVSLLAHRDYDPDRVREALRRLLEPLGGMGGFVKPGAKVLLKPNLVFGGHPDRAINTHPEILRAVAAEAFAAGASKVSLGDSPGYGSGRSAAKAAGYLPVAEDLGLDLVEFTPVDNVSGDRSFVKLELARELGEADVVVNLPKMKTHGQMLMTLAVKNMFGAVPGAKKFQWHYRAGRDRMVFARVINEIARAVRPQLSILDAVIGMDRVGPTAGRPRPVGFLAAAGDPWALDAAIMDVLGVPRRELYTLAAAEKHGPRDWLDLQTVGDDPGSLRLGDWEFPEAHTLQMHGKFIERHLPSVAAWLRSSFSPPPRPKANCAACGHCAKICPAQAMRIEDGKVKIDESACIRCYCCHELCQFQAMEVKRPGLLGRMLGLRGG